MVKFNKGIMASSLGLILGFSAAANATNEILGDYNGDGNQDAFNQAINTGEASSLTAKEGTSVSGFHVSWTATHPDIVEIEDWSAQNYSAQSSNLNDNPGDELLLLGQKQIILLHRKVITPIVIPKSVPNAIISWDASGVASYAAFDLDVDPDNFTVSFADFDGDGDQEIFLQNKSSGGDSYIVTGDAVVSQTLSHGYLGTDWSANSSLAFVDDNGDGRIDIRITDVNGNVTVAYASASGTFVTTPEAFSERWARKYNGQVASQSLTEQDTIINENVGAVPGQAGVSGGAATYSIPVSMAPGRNGMQPSVSLNYSSRSGNGIAGVGWSLSAGGAISRCGPTFAQGDSVTRGVQFDAAKDKLCLNGQRLMVTNDIDYGVTGAEYRTELDSFVRVKQTGGINEAGTTFTVEHNSGLKQHYGVSGSYGAELVPGGLSTTLTWLLAKEEKDSDKNTIVYQYDNDTADGEVVLTHIFYTGEGSTAGDRQVSFSYRDDRPDTNTSYMAGGKLRQTKLLDEITTYYAAQRVAKYTLNYSTGTDGGIVKSDASGRAILHSIEMCGVTNSDCLNPTHFSWLQAETNYQVHLLADNTGTALNGGEDYWYMSLVPHGDINGDGIRDWPHIDADRDGVAERKGFYLSPEGDKQEHDFVLNDCQYETNLYKRRICIEGDFDLNGTTDIWRIKNGKLEIEFTEMSNGVVSTRTVVTDVPMTETAGYQDFIIYTADYTGDGWPDLLISRYNNPSLRVYLYPNTRDINAPFIESSRQELYSYSQGYSQAANVSIQHIGDMDGNGFPDLAVSYSDKAYAKPYLSELLLTQFNGTTVSFNAKDISFFKNQTNHFQMFFDVNADGLDDLIGWGETSQSLLAKLNLGNGNFGSTVDLGITLPARGLRVKDPEPNAGYMIQTTPRYSDAFKIMDVNGDGRNELIMPGTRLVEGCIKVYHNSSPVAPGANNLVWRCGDAVYNPVRTWDSVNGWMYSNILTYFDFSIYQYDAIYFDEDSAGAITPRVENTDLIAAANSASVVDGFGKGLSDLVFSYGCTPSLLAGEMCSTTVVGSMPAGVVPGAVYYNRNYGSSTVSSNLGDYQPRDMLSGVTDAMGVEAKWAYLPLSSNQQPSGKASSSFDLYKKTDAETAPDGDGQFAFASSMYVVSQLSQTNPLGGLNDVTYQYEGAVYNAEGRGFQGFRRIIVDTPTQIGATGEISEHLRSTTNFHQEFPLAGQIQSAYTCLADTDVSCETGQLSSTEIGYVTTTTATSDTHWIFPGKTMKSTYALTGFQTSFSESWVGADDPGSSINVGEAFYDKLYGRIYESVNRSDTGFGTSEVRTQQTYYSPNTTTWWINKPKVTSVTTKALETTWATYEAGLDSDKTVTTTVSAYNDPTRKPAAVTTTATNAKQATTSTTYNAYGLPSVVTISSPGETSRTVTTTFSTDKYFVKTVKDDTGAIITSDINPLHGQANSVTDPNEINTVNTYDNLHRLETSKTDGSPKNYIKTRWCDVDESDPEAVPECGSITDAKFKVVSYAAGAPETTAYKNSLGQDIVVKTQKFDGNDVYVNTTFDRLGRTLFESVPAALPTSIVGTSYTQYDVLGRLKNKISHQTFDPNQNINQYLTVTYVYDLKKNANEGPYRTKITVNNTRDMYRTHSASGQLMRTTDAAGNFTHYAYDGMGNPIVLEDANTAQITATYNGLAQKAWVDDPNMGQKTFTYTGFGEVKTETDARGNVTTYTYDQLGRVIERGVAGPDETANSYFYFDKENNAADKCFGMLSEEVKGTGDGFAKSYHYNSLCQLEKVITTIDEVEFEVNTRYDSQYGRPLSIQYPNDLTVAYAYTTEGYLQRVYNPASDYTYRHVTGVDEQGNWTTALYADDKASVSRDYYLETGQLRSTEWYSSNSLQQMVDYLYNDYGNLTTQTVDNYWVGPAIKSVESYAYDVMNRLTSSILKVDNSTINTYSYGYDAVGNITKKTDFSQATPNAYTYPAVSSTRNVSNGWAGPNAVRSVLLNDGSTRTYDYDENGNLVRDKNSNNDSVRTMTYNAFNKPTRIQTAALKVNRQLDSQAMTANTSDFYYGSDQMRYKQVKDGNGEVSTYVYIGKLYEQVTKRDSNDNLISIEKKSYIDDIAVVVEKEDAAGAVTDDASYFHQDRLGSTIAEVDVNGVIQKGHGFDPFGRPKAIDLRNLSPYSIFGGVNTDRGFTGHEQLDESQLIHMNGRVYDYNLGRFLSVDPFIQDPGNSQSMNPYSYIMNNPLSGTDPSGYIAVTGSRIDKTPRGIAFGGSQTGIGSSNVSFEGTMPIHGSNQGGGSSGGNGATPAAESTPHASEPTDRNNQDSIAKKNKGEGNQEMSSPDLSAGEDISEERAVRTGGTIIKGLVSKAKPIVKERLKKELRSKLSGIELPEGIKEYYEKLVDNLYVDPRGLVEGKNWAIEYSWVDVTQIGLALSKLAKEQGDDFLTAEGYGHERTMLARVILGKADKYTAAWYHHEMGESTKLLDNMLWTGQAYLDEQERSHKLTIQAQGTDSYDLYHPSVVRAYDKWFGPMFPRE